MRNKAWILLVVAGASLRPATGEACGNSYYEDVDPRVQAVQEGEALLSAGQLAGAAGRILKQYPGIASDTGAGSLVVRARTVMALAVVRNGGQWPVAAEDSARPKEPAVWAVTQLRFADREAQGLPRTRCNLAEALGASPDGAKEAAPILEDLAQKKVITSAHAWATLARLRKAQGAENGAWAALAECRKLATYNGICRLEAPRPVVGGKKAGGGSPPAKQPPKKSA